MQVKLMNTQVTECAYQLRAAGKIIILICLRRLTCSINVDAFCPNIRTSDSVEAVALIGI